MTLARCLARRGAVRARGFTLTELMVVVTLVGVLSAVGIASFRHQVEASKTSEAAAVVQAIRSAEESYRAETQVYLNVSHPDAWYPDNTFKDLYEWHVNNGHADLAAWRRLAVNVTQPVQFRYLVNAGMGGVAVETVAKLHLDGNLALGTPTEPWFVIQARSDYDQDGTYCNVLATSYTSELYVEHEGE